MRLTYLRAKQALPVYQHPDLRYGGGVFQALACALLLLSVPVLFFLLQSLGATNHALLLLAAVVGGYFFRLVQRAASNNRARFVVCLLLMLIAIFFWSLYFQMFYVLNVFIDRMVDRSVNVPLLGYHGMLPAPLFMALSPLFIFMLGPLMAKAWSFLAHRRCNVSVPMKFMWAIVMMVLAFGLLYSSVLHAHDHLVAKGWIVGAYFFITVGELLLSPMGLSILTVIAPKANKGLMMGVWFLALGYGGGKLSARFANIAAIPAGVHARALMWPIYQHAFFMYCIIAVLLALVTAGLLPILYRFMHRYAQQEG